MTKCKNCNQQVVTVNAPPDHKGCALGGRDRNTLPTLHTWGVDRNVGSVWRCAPMHKNKKNVETDAGELRLMLLNLHDQRNRLKGGDGFTFAGTLIGQYKRTIAQFETLIELMERTPAEEAQPENIGNPDCLGRGSDNIQDCTCRLVFDSIR